MSTYSQTIQAGGSWEIGVPGDLVRIVGLTGAIDITLKKNGVPASKSTGVLDGYWLKPDGGFNGVLIESATTQAVTIAIESGDAGYDRTAGQVGISNWPSNAGAFSVSAATVATASGQLLAANANRRYMLIQNNGTADIFINLGAAATAAGGVRIGPGGSWEMSNYVATQAVNAISVGAANGSVIVVEG